MHREIIDEWTVRMAWDHTHGGKSPPKAEDVSDEALSEIDAVIASYMGDESTLGRRKAAAALVYISPRFFECPLPPGPATKPEQRKHVSDAVRLAMVDECVDADQQDWIGESLSSWDLDSLDVSDWFCIWDSLGCSKRHMADMVVYEFYKFAQGHVRYSSWR